MRASRVLPFLASALLLAAAACGRDEPPPVPPSLPEAFPDLLLPPDPTLISRTGGERALTITLRSDQPYEQVLEFYRGVLTVEPWKIVSDARDAEAGRAIYAERDGHPMWVRLRPEGQGATRVELTGAVTRAEAASLKAAADSASRDPDSTASPEQSPADTAR